MCGKTLASGWLRTGGLLLVLFYFSLGFLSAEVTLTDSQFDELMTQLQIVDEQIALLKISSEKANNSLRNQDETLNKQSEIIKMQETTLAKVRTTLTEQAQQLEEVERSWNKLIVNHSRLKKITIAIVVTWAIREVVGLLF